MVVVKWLSNMALTTVSDSLREYWWYCSVFAANGGFSIEVLVKLLDVSVDFFSDEVHLETVGVSFF